MEKENIIIKSFKNSFLFTKNYLFMQFNFKKWLALSLVVFLKGAGGGGNSNFNYNKGSHSSKHDQESLLYFKSLLKNGLSNNLSFGTANLPTFAMPMFIVLGVLVIAFILTFGWISSIFQFIFIENLAENHFMIKIPFIKHKEKGTSYFIFSLSLGFIFLILLGLFVGLPSILFYKAGFFANPNHNIIPLLIGGLYLILFIILFAITASIIFVLCLDFVLPLMYLKDTGIIEAWKSFLPLLSAKKIPIFFYILAKIVISIARFLIQFFIGIVIVLIWLIPNLVLALFLYLIAVALGLTWTTITIIICSIIFLISIILLNYLMCMAILPIEVFVRAFSLDYLGRLWPEYRVFK